MPIPSLLLDRKKWLREEGLPPSLPWPGLPSLSLFPGHRRRGKEQENGEQQRRGRPADGGREREIAPWLGGSWQHWGPEIHSPRTGPDPANDLDTRDTDSSGDDKDDIVPRRSPKPYSRRQGADQGHGRSAAGPPGFGRGARLRLRAASAAAPRSPRPPDQASDLDQRGRVPQCAAIAAAVMTRVGALWIGGVRDPLQGEVGACRFISALSSFCSWSPTWTRTS